MILGEGGNAHKKSPTCFRQLSYKNLVLANKAGGSVAGAGSRGSGKGGWVSRGLSRLQPSWSQRQRRLMCCDGHACCMTNVALHSL